MFITFKRWKLRDGSLEDRLVALVREFIVPAYHKHPGCLGIDLLRIEGTQSYLATQRWESRAAFDVAISSESYAKWWAEYLPVLEKFDEIMVFEEEWETVDLLK